MIKRLLVCFYIILPMASAAESSVTFKSPSQQATLLELYTSEGCSSCPPADRWLSTLKDDPRLWKEIIPIAFHVDYWNYLGWDDKFSKAEYSQRQRNYARFKNIRTVYTPGFIQNGREWRGWFRSRSLNLELGNKVGRLEVKIDQGIVTANFQPEQQISDTLILNVAWLGFDLVTKIQGGENEGKNLGHDFVSYDTRAIRSEVDGNSYRWQFPADIPMNALPKKKGVAFGSRAAQTLHLFKQQGVGFSQVKITGSTRRIY